MKLEDPPRSSFGILRPPIFHPKKIEGPPISPPPPPPSNLNYDWSLSGLNLESRDKENCPYQEGVSIGEGVHETGLHRLPGL